MSDSEHNEPMFPPAVMLKDACPLIYQDIREQLKNLGTDRIARQLDSVSIALQALDGSPGSFSFMAYPLPRLTQEQRQAMDLQDPESIDIDLGGAQIRIDLDDFGQINWFYVTNLPGMYSDIRKFMPA
jgi:hypothetical protein